MDSLLKEPMGSEHSEILQQLTPRIVDIELTLGGKSMEFGGAALDKVSKGDPAKKDGDDDTETEVESADTICFKQQQKQGRGVGEAKFGSSSDSDTPSARGRAARRTMWRPRRPRGGSCEGERGEHDQMSHSSRTPRR